MRFKEVRLNRETEIAHMPRPNNWVLSLTRGCDLRLDETGAGITVTHPERDGTIWIPCSNVQYAEVLEEPERMTAPMGELLKRGPGRPRVNG